MPTRGRRGCGRSHVRQDSGRPWTSPPSRQLLDDVRAGVCSADDAVRRLRRLPFADLGFARSTTTARCVNGLAEAVYGPGKTPEQCAAIVGELLAGAGGSAPVLLTRAGSHPGRSGRGRGHPDPGCPERSR